LPHLSVYSLILEEGTQLEHLVQEGKVELPDEESSFYMYEMTTDRLEKSGLKRYEISNYAKPGQESLHNKVYWHYEPYAAFGVGACAFTGKERRTNTLDVRKYIEGWSSPESSLHNNGLWETERLDRKTQISEAVIMGLRLTSGVDLTILKRRFDADIMEEYEKEIQTLLDQKMAEHRGGMLRLTPYGMRYGNQAFEAFV